MSVRARARSRLADSAHCQMSAPGAWHLPSLSLRPRQTFVSLVKDGWRWSSLSCHLRPWEYYQHPETLSSFTTAVNIKNWNIDPDQIKSWVSRVRCFVYFSFNGHNIQFEVSPPLFLFQVYLFVMQRGFLLCFMSNMAANKTIYSLEPSR